MCGTFFTLMPHVTISQTKPIAIMSFTLGIGLSVVDDLPVQTAQLGVTHRRHFAVHRDHMLSLINQKKIVETGN
jgi:hypothetical protein